jgi:hypothetical protein
MVRNKFTDLPKKDTGNGGYGKLVPQIDKPRMSMQSFPYRNSLTDPGLSSEDDEPIIDDAETLDRFVSKVNLATVSSDPKAWRSDKAAFVHNQRLALPESSMPAQRTNSISPMPFRSLYKHFNGPPIGGDMNQRNTTGSSFKTGTKKGFASSPPDIVPDEDINVFDIEEDMPTDDIRAIMRQSKKIDILTRGQKIKR